MVHHWGKDRPAVVLTDEGGDVMILICGSTSPQQPGQTILAVSDAKLMQAMGLHQPTYFRAEGVVRKHINDVLGSAIGRCTSSVFDALLAGVYADVEAARRAAEMPTSRPRSGARSLDVTAPKRHRR